MSEKESGFRTLLGASGEELKTTRSAAIAQIAFERMSLFAAVFGFALLLVKIMRVSHLNSRSSLGLLSTVGPVEIILGAMVTHFPAILFVIALLVTWWGAGSFAVLRTVTTGHMAAAATVLFAVMLLPWPFVAALFVVGGARFLHRRFRPEGVQRAGRYYILVGAAAVLLITDADPWLPPETFALKDGTELLGYALAEPETSTGWVVLLHHGNRSVLRIREESIAERKPCHLTEADFELEHFPSLLQVAIGESSDLPEPECREASPD
jgi:hypothetical protein